MDPAVRRRRRRDARSRYWRLRAITAACGQKRSGGFCVRLVLEEGRQQIGVSRKHLPQQGQQSFVGQDRFPRRLDPAGRGARDFFAECVVKHPFPGIELEGERDLLIVEIDEAAGFAPADALDGKQSGGEAGLFRRVFEVSERGSVFRVVEHSRQMQVVCSAELFPGLDQALMQRVELVGACLKQAPLDSLFEPCPLKHRGLEDRGRSVGVIFQKFGVPAAAIAEIEAAIEAAVVAAPGVADQRPERLGYPQPPQMPLVFDHATAEFAAHRVDFAGRRLDPVFDFGECEGVKGALVPVAHAVDGMKIEAAGFCRRLPVIAFAARDTLHEDSSTAAGKMRRNGPCEAAKSAARRFAGP